MATITLSSKNQVTLPVEMVRGLGLKPGDKIVVELIDGRLVLLPQPANWANYFLGSAKGAWGSPEELEIYLEELRAGPERDEWREEVRYLLATDEDAQKIVEWLQKRPRRAVPEQEFYTVSGVNKSRIPEVLAKLDENAVITKLATEERSYQLVRDALIPKWQQFVEELLKADHDARKMVDWLSVQPQHASPENKLLQVPGITQGRAPEILNKLETLTAVRRLPGADRVYLLRRELVTR